MKVYTYQAALLCEDCGKAKQSELLAAMDKPSCLDDGDRFPQGPFPNGGGEADCPQHCDHCGAFLENPLTPEGQAFTREAVARETIVPGRGTCITEWREFYSHLFG